MTNPAQTHLPTTHPVVASDRRQQDRILTKLPMRIVAINGTAVYHPAWCLNLSRGGVGFETSARMEVGRVIEFEFTQAVDEVVRYSVRLLFRDGNHYGGYYVNEDGSDIRPAD